MTKSSDLNLLWVFVVLSVIIGLTLGITIGMQKAKTPLSTAGQATQLGELPGASTSGDLGEQLATRIRTPRALSFMFSITSVPAGAEVYLNNNYVGTTPSLTARSYGIYNIRLVKENFQNLTQTVTVGPNSLMKHVPGGLPHFTFHGTLELLPGYGLATFTTTPTGANIYLDNQLVGTTNKNIALQEYIYQLKYTKEGYEDYTTSIEIYDGAHQTFHKNLTPIPTTGDVTFTSTPTAAEVSVDGAYEGNTELQLTLDTGSHSVLFQKIGYYDDNTNINVNPGSQTVHADLDPIPSQITFTSTPTDAMVYVDDIYKGNTELPQVMDAGSYNVKFTKNRI